ncbi:MAG: hypothetical protein Q6K99_08295 [Thermostichales cyanobacterium BF4_bins_65]
MRNSSLRLIPIILLVGLVMVIFIQQQEVFVDWVWFGRVIPQVSLGLLLVVAYGVGLLLGSGWELLWFFRDYLRDRKAQRYLQKLDERITLLEDERPKLVPINWSNPDL